jgi:CheY-like chemotaxis protein
MADRKPTVILLDLMMPAMDGFEFVDEIRRRGDWQDIPIIVVTARDLTAQDRARLNGRIERVIQKTEANALLAEVRLALDRFVDRRRGGNTAVA